MLKADVIKYFGSVGAVAQALQIKSAAVSQWPDTIPKLRAYEIERITNGQLKVAEPMKAA
jgi:transcriptional repressor of cell division inhibition gene dicB